MENSCPPTWNSAVRQRGEVVSVYEEFLLSLDTLAGCSLGGGGTPSDNTVSLYQAVGPNELMDIQTMNQFRAGPNSYEGKLFATSESDAAEFGRINVQLGGNPFTLVQADVPSSFADSLYQFEADGMAAVSVNPDQLSELNEVADITILDYISVSGGGGDDGGDGG
jgi:hypothetical protein